MKKSSLKPLSGPQASDARAFIHALSDTIGIEEALRRFRSAPSARMIRAEGGCSSWSPVLPAVDTEPRHND